MSTNPQPDIDAARAIDHLVEETLLGRRGPGWALPAHAHALLRLLRFCPGAAKAHRIDDLALLLDVTPRDIKAAARTLVCDFGLPIAGSRRPPYGYYLAVTADEIGAALDPLVGELRAIAQRVRSLGGRRRLQELLGQIELDLSGPEEAA
jgi:hypothetical protein